MKYLKFKKLISLDDVYDSFLIGNGLQHPMTFEEVCLMFRKHGWLII